MVGRWSATARLICSSTQALPVPSQKPFWHWSTMVQALPSSHGLPGVAAIFTQRCSVGSQSAALQASPTSASQSRSSPPPQLPDPSQTVATVQKSSLVHGAPAGFGRVVQLWLVAPRLTHAASLHSSAAPVHVTAVPGRHTPLGLQLSPLVQPSLSLHAVPCGFLSTMQVSPSSSHEPTRHPPAAAWHGSPPPWQPPTPSHVSFAVQYAPSWHCTPSSAKPPAMQKPSSQWSPVVQPLPSSHAMSLARTKSHPPPALQVGVRQSSPVSQSSPTGNSSWAGALDRVVVPSVATARQAARSQSCSAVMVALPTDSAPPLRRQ